MFYFFTLKNMFTILKSFFCMIIIIIGNIIMCNKGNLNMKIELNNKALLGIALLSSSLVFAEYDVFN